MTGSKRIKCVLLTVSLVLALDLGTTPVAQGALFRPAPLFKRNACASQHGEAIGRDGSLLLHTTLEDVRWTGGAEAVSRGHAHFQRPCDNNSQLAVRWQERGVPLVQRWCAVHSLTTTQCDTVLHKVMQHLLHEAPLHDCSHWIATLDNKTGAQLSVQFQAAVEVVVNPSDEATWCFLAAPTQPVAQCVQQSVAELGVHADLVHAVGQYAQQQVDSTSQAWIQPTAQRRKPDIGVALQPQFDHHDHHKSPQQNATNLLPVAVVFKCASMDIPFVRPLLRQAQLFASAIVVVLSDRLFDGTMDALPDLLALVREYAHEERVHFVLFQADPAALPAVLSDSGRLQGKGGAFWTGWARWVGVNYVNNLVLDGRLQAEAATWVLLADGDEVIDGNRFRHWFRAERSQSRHTEDDNNDYDAYELASFLYAGSAAFRVRSGVDSYHAGLLVRRCIVQRRHLLGSNDRYWYLSGSTSPEGMHVKLYTTDRAGVPLVHHYAYVRTHQHMLRKLAAWGHAHEEYAATADGESRRHTTALQAYTEAYSGGAGGGEDDEDEGGGERRQRAAEMVLALMNPEVGARVKALGLSPGQSGLLERVEPFVEVLFETM